MSLNIYVSVPIRCYRAPMIPVSEERKHAVLTYRSTILIFRRKLARLIIAYRNIFSNISEGMALVISYFLYFQFVMFKTRVILCNTLKKEGVPSKILENIYLYRLISLANNFCLLFNFKLIRSSTARGSSTSVLSWWSL